MTTAEGALRAGVGAARASSPLDRTIALAVILIASADTAVLLRPRLVALEPIPILVAVGATCAALLTRVTAPSLAWLAAITGAYAGSTVAIAQARAADPGALTVGTWLGWAVPSGIAAIVTIAVALGYATRRDPATPPLGVALARSVAAWVAFAIVLTLVAVSAGERADPAFTWIDVATLPIAWFVPFVVGIAAVGALADLRRGLDRARERLGPASLAQPRPQRVWALALATANELVPGQTAAARVTLEAERVRLAGDLHASVLPALRRAIADAEGGGDPEDLARRLRSVDLELERLMADRWPIVLESFGLVAALEDLAERLEADGAPPVTIDVDRADGRPPLVVERAAWRFAQVALDNAVRHAAAATIAVRAAVDPANVRLLIADDGVGIDPTGATRSGARGLADAARRAEAVGARAGVARRAAGGTEATFEWAASARL